MRPIIAPQDIELGRVRHGYPTLAKWIAQDPDGEPLLFRKFGTLAARNILHLQCQLVKLEHEIEDLDEEIRTTENMETQRCLQRWENLMENAKVPNSLESKQVAKLAELQELLKEYYDALTLHAQVAQLRKPNGRILATYDDFLSGKAFAGENHPALPLISGRARQFVNDTSDLVTLQNPSNQDYLSRLLRDHWLFKKSKPSHLLDRTMLYKDMHISRTVAALSMVLAALLLIGAIVNLYFVEKPGLKLGLIAMYTLLFALSITLCTNARRAEVFGAAAAYAAVLVGT
ncbi:hypothetical protein BDW02DRAFT_588228 [Decorospora gaudefroyi]|uniref:DUF6594 domain-containing protein n=1 Tax=Decorospora gaudefroyi TaxID=184978 RepID=A0A6A5KHP1_9PLEO|nr:hypothetical protein BDW02DRAFT_588228 [Decorospora gaudefroyi]